MLVRSGGQRRRWKSWTGCALAAMALGVAPATAQEAEEPETGWLDEAELSLVATDGNSQSETFSMRNTLTRRWRGAELKITAGGLRAESTIVSRGAIGDSAADARLTETSTSDVTAERYYLDTRYDREISQRWYWYAAAGWERNEPAGVKNRTTVAAGAGNTWFEDETAHLKTDYGLTWTDQEDVVERPGGGGGFAGVRLTSDYRRRLTATTEFANRLTFDLNLDDGDDQRLAMVNSLAVRMSDSLALKLSHELQFDNQPSLVAVPVFTEMGDAVGEDLLVEADDVDTTLSLALVVAF